ncbi:TonB-dependent receptor [Ningiella sp. W23]|uniref:TonB-dependent receptor n=1 Tax=Ningiella sp. W23 TaxID=3023715 RepID=UPI0037580E57
MTRLPRKLLLTLALFGAQYLHCNVVHANESALEQDIEVISVSATKRPIALSQVASSLSVISNQEISLIEAQHINQVMSRISGTWISRGNGQEHLTAIRSPVLTGAGSCAAFFMALDGISLRAPGFCNANQLFDANSEQAARIELLKGPSSTLYGTNALHGAINIISPDAFDSNGALTNPNASFGLQLGAYDFARLSGDIQIENGQHAFRLLSNVTQENGFQSDSGYDQQKATLIYQGRDFRFGSQNWDNKTVVDIANLNQETAGFIRGFEAYADEQIRETNPNPEAFRDAKSLRAYSSFSTQIDDSTLAITPYIRWNDMQFLQHFLPWQGLEENSHRSAGLKIQYNHYGLGADWISGIDIDFTQANLRETQDEPFSPSIPEGEHYDYNVDASVFAAFVQGEWRGNKLAFIAGTRIERTEYDYDNLLSDGSACADEVEVCRFSRPSDQSLSFTSFSPQAVLEYSVNDASLAYVKYSQGFRAPQATELFRLQNNQLASDLDEVRIDAFELGYRFNTDAHGLHIAYFDMQKQDVIVLDTDRQFISDGDTSHRGLELEYRWQITPNWRFSTNATWQKHVYESDLAIANTSIKGNRIDTAPDELYGARLLWDSGNKLYWELAWQYLSEYFLDPQNTAEYEGHSLLDLTLEYELSDNVRLKLSVFNLTDEDYAERADFAFGGYRYFVGQPRRVFASIKWDV